MPYFELLVQRREYQRKSPKIPGIPPYLLPYFIRKIQDICLLVDVRNISKWAVHSIKVVSAKLQNDGRLISWTRYFVSHMAVEVSMPDADLSTFWVFLQKTISCLRPGRRDRLMR